MDFSKLLHWPFVLEHTEEINNTQWLIVKGVGLVIVAFFIVKFVWPTFIQPSLTERQLDIANQSDQIEQTMKETEQLRNDYKARLAAIEDEARKRLDEAVHEAETLKGRILSEAAITVESVEQRTRMELERERAKAVVGIQRTFVEDVIGAAHYAAEKSLDEKAQAALVDDFIGKVSVAA